MKKIVDIELINMMLGIITTSRTESNFNHISQMIKQLQECETYQPQDDIKREKE